MVNALLYHCGSSLSGIGGVIRPCIALIGHPLLGDPLYGGDRTRFEAIHKTMLEGQALHAGELSFIHPRTKELVHFTAPMPPKMQRLVSFLFGEDSKTQ